jgi:gluconolactonase
VDEQGTADLSQVKTVIEGLDHPEGLTVDADGTMWAGGESGQIYRIDIAGGRFEQVASTGGFLLGVTADGGRYVYVCDIKRCAVLRLVIASGAVEVVVEDVAGRRLINPNYAVFDARGNLYVTDSGHWNGDDGYIFVIRPDGSTEILDEQARHFPNGLAWDEERGELYVVESTTAAVVRLRLSDGRLDRVVDLPRTVPDGVGLDEDRSVYVACYRPDTIIRISGGTASPFLSDWQGTVVSAPTNVAFGGSDRRDMYFGSLGRWHIGMVRVPAPGLPLCYPAASRPEGA